MRKHHQCPPAPDYTRTCIVMFGVNLAWFLLLIWALWGLAAGALAGWLVHRLIARIRPG
ncbi:hypothetical protein ACFSUD_06110 [Sulfitobacter aestuarii]|uniref:Histidinol phosphate aminotransferase n=1 Tax=Sulfitobacter aestuarii TaxID=2161676 RepID=A0ABW5U0Y6_9RHOB